MTEAGQLSSLWKRPPKEAARFCINAARSHEPEKSEALAKSDTAAKDDKAPKDAKAPPAKGEKPAKDEKAPARVA